MPETQCANFKRSPFGFKAAAQYDMCYFYNGFVYLVSEC